MIDTWEGDRDLHRRAGHHGVRGRATPATEARAHSRRRRGELVTLIETTRALVGFTDRETVPVSYSGGMFSDDGFLARFVTALEGAARQRTTCGVPLLDPAVGAALYAAKHSGHPLSRDARAATRRHATTFDEVTTS